MKSAQLIRLSLAATIVALLTSPGARAADATGANEPAAAEPAAAEPAAAPADQPTAKRDEISKDTQTLEGVVVTGNASGRVKKIDASYTITAVDAEQIKRANPKSTADLLKVSPGLWPESSGGQTGANIEIAGFPGGGDAPFFTAMLNGSPLFGMPSLSFFEQSSMIRLDDTIDRAEVVLGGPSVVFADGQIGATANFILKQGTDERSGSIGLTYGDEGLWRADGFYGFKIADDWYGSVGGFWRTSDGVRDPQFKSDQGGQFTATVTHDLENGSFMLYARVLDDKNQFITPIPLIQSGKDDFSAYPGFDPLTDTYYSNALRHVHLESYPGGGTDADLADGRGADVHFVGGNFDYDFGGFQISDKFLFSGGNMDTNGLFSGTNPETLAQYYADQKIPAGANVSANYTDGSGAVTDLNQSVISQGWWHIHKHMKNFNNDFRLSREIFTDNTLTAGLYYAHYSTDDKWSLGNPMLMTNTPNATPIAVSYVDANGVTKYVTDRQGLIFNSGYNITEDGVATNKAFYLSDSWRVERWLFDASIRIENEDAHNTVCNLSDTNLDNDPNTLYNNTVQYCNGTFARTDYDKTHPSWTVGANYEIADNQSVYARANKGAHFNSFDDMRGHPTGDTPPLLKVRNYEIGYKYQADWIFADISVYHKQFSGLPYQPSINGVPQTQLGTLLYGSDSKGLNFNVKVTPFENFTVQLLGDYLDGKYSHFVGDTIFFGLQTPDNQTGEFRTTFNGKQLQRQPKLQFRVTPGYRVPLSTGDLNFWVTYEHVGDHTQDQTALQQLGSYYDFSIGATLDYGKNWQFRLQGTNVTNELGLTESNSRIAGSAAGTDGVILARPLEGREVNFQVKYRF